jgi:hypothetical protein
MAGTTLVFSMSTSMNEERASDKAEHQVVINTWNRGNCGNSRRDRIRSGPAARRQVQARTTQDYWLVVILVGFGKYDPHRHAHLPQEERNAERGIVFCIWGLIMIRKLKSGKYRLYSRKVDAKTGKRKNLGTFDTRAAAEKHERAVQFFKRRG